MSLNKMDDWQNRVKTLCERTNFIFENKLFCDCAFSVGNETIKCHKLILAMASTVFNAMFYGGMPQQKDPIIVTDIEPETFLSMIKHIYQDEIEIHNYKQACFLYHAANKYMLKTLEKDCIRFLIKYVNHENVIEIYEFSQFYNEHKLESHCLKELQLNTSNVLKSKWFCSTGFSTMNTILDLNRLNIVSEMELIIAIETWATYQISKLEKQMTGTVSEEMPRKVASKLIKKLRFLTLTKDEFLNELVNSQLLNDSEKLAVLLRILKPELPPMDNGLCEMKIKRNPYKSKSISTLIMENLSEARCDGSEWLTSNFESDSRIDLLGVELNLQLNEENSTTYNENIMVKVGLASKEDHFAEGSLSGDVAYNGKAEVMFNTIPTLEPFEEYSIHIFLCSPGTYPFGRHSTLSCKNMNVKIDFLSHSSWEGSHPRNTTVLSKIIYRDPL